MNEKLWIWGKGDGGRLGFGHEDAAFVPTLNPYLDDPVRCIALGGVHSVALTSLGQLFTWSVLNPLCNFFKIKSLLFSKCGYVSVS